MAMIAILPHAPQALTRMVDALAEAAGEPCTASIADEASYNVSIQNRVYGNKMRGQPSLVLKIS